MVQRIRSYSLNGEKMNKFRVEKCSLDLCGKKKQNLGLNPIKMQLPLKTTF